jgi:hypothetical protein
MARQISAATATPQEARAIATDGTFDGFAGLMSNAEFNAFFAGRKLSP